MSFEMSNPQKVLFPDSGITKADLADHYHRVASHMLRHIKGRPLAMERFPDGVQKPGFLQKNVPEHFPGWVARVKVDKAGGTLMQATADDTETLVYLANEACITPHVWLSRTPRLRRPDRLVFDLDPSPGTGFNEVREAAHLVGRLVSELGLEPFAMTTGSRGLHLWVPLRPRPGFDEVRRFARDAAGVLVRRHPEALTIEQRKARRGARVLIDVMRNAYAQTAVAPYAARALAGAPVATPLHWRELSGRSLAPDRFTIATIPRRLISGGDPWAQMSRHARDLRAPRRRLDELLAANGRNGSGGDALASGSRRRPGHAPPG